MEKFEQSLDELVRQLDAVEIRNPENPEWVVGRIGLVGTIYLPPNPDPAYRQRLGTIVDGFIEQHIDAFQWRTEDVGEGKLRVRPRATGLPFAETARLLGGEALFSGMAGSSPADDLYPAHVPGTHQIQFFIPGPDLPREAGHLRFSLPLAWERDTQGPALLTLLRELCNNLSPLHGSAGLGFIYPPVYAGAFDAGVEGTFYPGVQRFPGIDATPPLIGDGELDALPTLNWLTAVSNPFLERIGGAAAIKKELETGPFQFYDYPGGVLCQAGPAPLPGDRDQGNIPLPYQQLYHVLKPVMMESVENPFVLDGVSEDEEAMYAAYARRFE